MACEAKNKDFFLPSLTNFCEKSGTKALVKAPSANKLRNKFGNLKETKNASDAIPAPKKLASAISRTNPVIRLKNVNPPKVAIDLNKDIFLFFLFNLYVILHKKAPFARIKKTFTPLMKKNKKKY